MKRPIFFLILPALLFLASACSASGDSGAADSLRQAKKKGAAMHPLAKHNTPVFWAEGHPGQLDREGWTVEVTGFCARPRTFSWAS